MAGGTADVEAPASPYGSYRRSSLARLGFTVGPALLVTTAWNTASPVPGVRTTAWDLSALIFSCIVFVGIQLGIWLVPLTVIDERGIRRTLNRPRRIGWDEVQDFSVEGYERSAWVFVHLSGGRRVRLYGVPAAVVPGLLGLIGVPPERFSRLMADNRRRAEPFGSNRRRRGCAVAAGRAVAGPCLRRRLPRSSEELNIVGNNGFPNIRPATVETGTPTEFDAMRARFAEFTYDEAVDFILTTLDTVTASVIPRPHQRVGRVER